LFRNIYPCKVNISVSSRVQIFPVDSFTDTSFPLVYIQPLLGQGQDNRVQLVLFIFDCGLQTKKVKPALIHSEQGGVQDLGRGVQMGESYVVILGDTLLVDPGKPGWVLPLMVLGQCLQFP
jgi:hypothetical protein